MFRCCVFIIVYLGVNHGLALCDLSVSPTSRPRSQHGFMVWPYAWPRGVWWDTLCLLRPQLFTPSEATWECEGLGLAGLRRASGATSRQHSRPKSSTEVPGFRRERGSQPLGSCAAQTRCFVGLHWCLPAQASSCTTAKVTSRCRSRSVFRRQLPWCAGCCRGCMYGVRMPFI